MQTFALETLRSWLDEGRSLTVLDMRPTAERAEWFIPGSIHIDALKLLKHMTRQPSPTFRCRTLLSRIPATPSNYRQIVRPNEQGLLPEVSVSKLEAGANRCAVS